MQIKWNGEEDNEAKDKSVKIKAKQVPLRMWFKKKSAEELTDILMTYIDKVPNEQDKWQLTMRSEESHLSASELSKLITKALPEKGVWGWNEVQDYFAHAEEMFATIFTAIEQLTITEQWQLILKALQRLNKILERVDDSGGFRFDLEYQLKQKLVALFDALPWSDERKAEWIFSHTEEYQYDVFPNVPEDFKLTKTVKQIFLEKCLAAVEHKVQLGGLKDWSYKWSIQRFTHPLIEQAVQAGNWQEQSRLMGMSAVDPTDYLAISDVCLENAATLEAANWLQQAYQQTNTAYEKAQCQKQDIKVRVALREFKRAWQLAWQLFSENPTFMDYKNLEKLQKKTGIIDRQFIKKAKQILADCYVETEQGISGNADALLDFYLDRNELEKARVWALSHKANPASLLKTANLIIVSQPTDAVALYYRVVSSIIAQTNKSAYQEATNLLIKLEKVLKANNIDEVILCQMIDQLCQENKQKRNMVKLLRERFACCIG